MRMRARSEPKHNTARCRAAASESPIEMIRDRLGPKCVESRRAVAAVVMHTDRVAISDA